jgi:hypothetical protein
LVDRNTDQALKCSEAAQAALEKTLGEVYPWTNESALITAPLSSHSDTSTRPRHCTPTIAHKRVDRRLQASHLDTGRRRRNPDDKHPYERVNFHTTKTLMRHRPGPNGRAPKSLKAPSNVLDCAAATPPLSFEAAMRPREFLSVIAGAVL